MTTAQSRMNRKSEESKAKKRSELAEFSRIKDIEHLIAQPQFHRFMQRLIASGGIMHSVFTGNSHTFHMSGRQDFAKEIWASIAEVDHDKALSMLKPLTDQEEKER